MSYIKDFGHVGQEGLSQKKIFLCKEVLNHFGMASAKPVCTPLKASILLTELNVT